MVVYVIFKEIYPDDYDWCRDSGNRYPEVAIEGVTTDEEKAKRYAEVFSDCRYEAYDTDELIELADTKRFYLASCSSNSVDEICVSYVSWNWIDKEINEVYTIGHGPIFYYNAYVKADSKNEAKDIFRQLIAKQEAEKMSVMI